MVTTEFFGKLAPASVLARRACGAYGERVKQNDPRRSKTEIMTAAAALASIGSLVGLTVSGVLARLPFWAAVLIVVGELLLPIVAFLAMRRRGAGD
jgi:uncharacterized membrane protein YgdD (TMEM256/DUF423 family)